MEPLCEDRMKDYSFIPYNSLLSPTVDEIVSVIFCGS
jgi:hypothetical protein